MDLAADSGSGADSQTGNQNIEITKTLEPGAFGLDPETLYI